MSYQTGWGAVETAMENAKRTGGTDYIQWKKDKEVKVVRLLTDDVISIKMHSFVKCNDGKPREFVCTQDLAKPRPCHICDNVPKEYKDSKTGETKTGKSYPSPTTIGMVALREETEDGFQDLVDDDGNVIVGMVKQGNKNFWSNFLPYFGRYGTAVDRDYIVERRGEGLDTTYSVMSADIDDDLIVKNGKKTDVAATQKMVAEHYAAALEGKSTLVDWIERMGSEEYYQKFLINDEPPAKDEDKSEDAAPETEEEEPKAKPAAKKAAAKKAAPEPEPEEVEPEEEPEADEPEPEPEEKPKPAKKAAASSSVASLREKLKGYQKDHSEEE